MQLGKPVSVLNFLVFQNIQKTTGVLFFIGLACFNKTSQADS